MDVASDGSASPHRAIDLLPIDLLGICCGGARRSKQDSHYCEATHVIPPSRVQHPGNNFPRCFRFRLLKNSSASGALPSEATRERHAIGPLALNHRKLSHSLFPFTHVQAIKPDMMIATPGIERVINDHPVPKHLVIIGEIGREA